MTETRASYLRRVLPDLEMIEFDVRRALDMHLSAYHLSHAITRTQKLLEDLERASRAQS